MRLKKSMVNFSPFGMKMKLPILGRTKCQIVAMGGAEIQTIVYVVAGETESLLGLSDGEALGIININPDSNNNETVMMMEAEEKTDVPKEGIVSGGQTQEEIDKATKDIVDRHPKMFLGLGRAKVDPVHIDIDKTVKPVRQKRRPVAIHYRQRMKDNLEELKKEGTISGPLDLVS